MPDIWDLQDIALTFHTNADSLTALCNQLEQVVGASDTPVNKRDLKTLYHVRDTALESYRKLQDLIDYLEGLGHARSVSK